MENNRNLFITIALSVLILTLWQVFYMNPRIEAERKAAEIEAARVEEQKKDAPANPGDRPMTPRAAAARCRPAFPAVKARQLRHARRRSLRHNASRSTPPASQARST